MKSFLASVFFACVLFWHSCFASSQHAKVGFNWDAWMSKTLRHDLAAQRASLQQMRDSGVSRVKIYYNHRDLIALISDAWGPHDLQLMIAVRNSELAALA